jgi:serine phosphatase RsbU (regulator of sigma subunit)
MGLAFSRRFLDLKTHLPLADRIVGLLFWGAFALFCLAFIPETYFFGVRALNIYMPLALLTYLSIGFLALKDGIMQTPAFIAGWLGIVIGVIFETATSAALIPVTLAGRNAIQLGTLLEAVLFAAALGGRVQRFSLDKERSRLRLKEMDSELERARRIHADLLPVKLPALDGHLLAVEYRPASILGGDFYGFHSRDQTELVALVADVAGHGVPAALDAALVRLAFRTAAMQETQPGAILTRMNEQLTPHVDYRIVSACCLRLHSSGRALVSTAGLAPPYLISTSSIQQVDCTGIPLGFRAGAIYSDTQFELKAGMRLLLCTNGLYESKSFTADEGLKKLTASLMRNADRKLEEFRAGVLEDIIKGAESAPDDITMLIVAREMAGSAR